MSISLCEDCVYYSYDEESDSYCVKSFSLIQIETEIILSQSLFLLLTNLSVFFKKFSYKTVCMFS